MDRPTIPTDERLADQGLDGHVNDTAGEIDVTNKDLVVGSAEFDGGEIGLAD